MNDCGGCKFCLDKRKFGGPGKLKKRCELRVCMTPRRMGAPSPKPMGAPGGQQTTMVSTGPKLPLEVRNKFLTTIENRQPIKIIENPPMQAENRVALENIIEMGLETYEVVNVNVVPQVTNGLGSVQLSNSTQVRLAPAEPNKNPCYICKQDNKEDLFYCSSCCTPFHQFCLHMQLGTAGSLIVSTTCASCQGTKADYEQAMNARAESIHVKGEEIDGAQYQVISFLTDAEHLKMPDMILQVEEEEAEAAEEAQTIQAQERPAQNPPVQSHGAHQLPRMYDNDFDAYLTTISLAE